MNATLKDIANIANVSITTVSKALANHPDISDETKARIKLICQEVSYVPNSIASNLRKNRTKFIGVIVTDSTNPYYASFLKTVETELSKNGFYTIIINTNDDEKLEKNYINELRSIHVAGIIITPTGDESIQILRNSDIPFVIANRYVDKDADNYVVADDEQAGYIATKKIIENCAHKQVFFLGPKVTISSLQCRVNGYLKALRENNIEINMGNVFMDAYNNEDGYNIAHSIIERCKPPLSFVCESDFIATGVLKALYEKNITIPEMAKVIGIDNIGIFTFAHPALTTVDIQKEKIGSTSVDILLNIIRTRRKGESLEEKRVVYPAQIIINSTC